MVIFEANDERLEGEALASVFARVQKKANVRLRHLNPAPDVQLAHQSYGTLQLADLVWADGIGIFLEPEAHRGLDVLTPVLEAKQQDQTRRRGAYLFSKASGMKRFRLLHNYSPRP